MENESAGSCACDVGGFLPEYLEGVKGGVVLVTNKNQRQF